MFHCRECPCYCSGGKVECPFYKGNHDLLSLPEIEARAKKKDRLSRIYLAVCRITGERDCGKPRAGYAELKRMAGKDPLAKGFLGLLYLDGDPKNRKKGFALCLDGGCQTGCHQVEAKLAWCYEHGIGTEIDLKEAERFRNTAGRRGNEALLMEVAGSFARGRGGSARDALYLYDRAVKMGLPMAQERYCSCRREHIDKIVGELPFTKAIDGDSNSLAQIARQFLEPAYAQDPQEALKWYKAAAMGGGSAALELAKLYLSGEYWAPDPGLAWWYLKQAQGDEEADALRQALEQKRDAHPSTPALRAMVAVLDRKKDPQRAREVLEQCAKEGSACAMEALGIAWFWGDFGETDRRKAFAYLEQARKQSFFSYQGVTVGIGSRLGSCYLAGCYYLGEGTAADKVRAAKILEKVFQVKLLPEKKFIPQFLWDSDGTHYVKTPGMLAQYRLKQLRRLPESCQDELAYGIDLLGCCLLDRDLKSEAAAAFELAAERGLASGHFHLALCGEQGVSLLPQVDTFVLGEKIDLSMPQEEIFRHYQAAEAGGMEAARYRLGLCYLEGKGTAPDPAEGVRLIALAAESGIAAAQEKLGDCFARGIGVKADIRSAAALYGKAFAAGEDVTGKLLECVKRDPGLEFTDPAICGKLGICYYQGKGVAKSYETAAKWLRKAGERDPEAVSMLAECYRFGMGVEKDLRESFRLHSLAAAKGIAQSQQALGVCYHEGQGVTRDHQAARKWFQAAADRGSALGRRNLGLMYELGEGMSADWSKALELYRQAEKASPSTAKKDIDRLEKKLAEKRRREAAAAVQRKPAPTYSAPTYSEPTYTPPSYTPTYYSPNPYESLDYDSSIRFVNRNLKTDLELCSSEWEKKLVLAKYQSNYPDIPLYETDTSYSPPDPLDDHDYLQLLNDIM